jgi:hypothetical protein
MALADPVGDLTPTLVWVGARELYSRLVPVDWNSNWFTDELPEWANDLLCNLGDELGVLQEAEETLVVSPAAKHFIRNEPKHFLYGPVGL